MRYLSKVIFINSATIPYAEMPLEGNTHFIGTQGVGKSTVLRAILYFYNADSRKLGIPHGPTVKSFADWYLSYSNSYLIYEVQRETGPFCVIAFRSKKRVCYRFIDTAYEKSLFINEAGEAADKWETIRGRLDASRINVSSMINSYEQYRDIIYGNFIGKKEFKKYALLESKQYNTIYRTIQNVFLNTKLDAAEIKQTIISSMEDEPMAIDLENYEHHLEGFEKELKDIRSFRQPKVQAQATNAIEVLSTIQHIREEQKKLVAQLLFRLNVVENEKPKLLEQRKQEDQSLISYKETRKKEKGQYDKRIQNITTEIGTKKGKVREADKQKKYYEDKDIHTLLKRIAVNEELKKELEALGKELQILTNESGDINIKYEGLIKGRENWLATYKNEKESQRITVVKTSNEFESKLNIEYEALFKKLEDEYAKELEEKDSILQFATESVHTLDKRKVKIKHTKLYEKETEQCEQALAKAKHKKVEVASNRKTLKSEEESERAVWNFEDKDLKRIAESEKEDLRRKLLDLKQHKDSLEDRIDKSKDSLYDWLNKNKPGWEQTIGKVIDIDLLFAADLSPQLSERLDSFFGVALALDDVKIKVKTIDDYRFELDKIGNDIVDLQKDLQARDSKLEKELDNTKRRHNTKLKELKEAQRQARNRFESLEQEIKKYEVELGNLKRKAQEERGAAIDAIQKNIDAAIVDKQAANKQLNSVKATLHKDKENKQREKKRRLKEALSQDDKIFNQIDLEVASKEKSTRQEIEILRNERNQELTKSGLDTNRLTSLESKKHMLVAELQFIDDNRDIVSDYKKDKRELFDQLKTFKSQIETLEKKVISQTSKFDLSDTKLAECIRNKELVHSQMSKEIEDYDTDIEKFELFLQQESYSVFENFKLEVDPQQNEKTAITIIDELRDKFYANIKVLDELKTSIDSFLSHFSEGNILQFPTKLIGTKEYLNWAIDLREYIEEDKIEEFEKRMNENFTSIIHSVSKETTNLISRTGEIKKITNKINTDFKHKSFLTAVSNIELDVTDSKNSAVMLLVKIKEFNDEHALNLGQANLFSDDNQDKQNVKAVELMKQLVKEVSGAKKSTIQLADSFELKFRIVENGNDTGWQEKLTNVGSEGTDVLVKAMINIMLLNVFKETASRRFKDFKLHCMMDEIGKLHPNNVKGILQFANERNILLINGSPTESTPLSYRHIYKISKNDEKQSIVKRIITNPINE